MTVMIGSYRTWPWPDGDYEKPAGPTSTLEDRRIFLHKLLDADEVIVFGEHVGIDTQFEIQLCHRLEKKIIYRRK